MLIHVFRGPARRGEVAVNAPGRIAGSPGTTRTALPQPMTATTRAAIADAVEGRSGVLRDVQRDPDAVPDTDEAEAQALVAT